MKSSEVIHKIEMLPEGFLKSVSDYIDFLLMKAKSESVASTSKKKFGTLKGKLWIADDFDAPLDEMKDYM